MNNKEQVVQIARGLNIPSRSKAFPDPTTQYLACTINRAKTQGCDQGGGVGAPGGTARRPTTGCSSGAPCRCWQRQARQRGALQQAARAGPHADAGSDRRDSAALHHSLLAGAPMQMLAATGGTARRPTTGGRSARQHLLGQAVIDAGLWPRPAAH